MSSEKVDGIAVTAVQVCPTIFNNYTIFHASVVWNIKTNFSVFLTEAAVSSKHALETMSLSKQRKQTNNMFMLIEVSTLPIVLRSSRGLTHNTFKVQRQPCALVSCAADYLAVIFSCSYIPMQGEKSNPM